MPTPDGVLAEIHVAHPDQAWRRVQPMLGSVFGFQPVSLSGTLTDLLGIPAAYSPGVAIEKPITGVVVDGEPPHAVVGIRMRSGGELVAALTTGSAPTHRAQVIDGTRVTLLEPLRRGAVGDLALGVYANTLLIGAHGDDLGRYGPYVASELSRRAIVRQGAGAASGTSDLAKGSFVVTFPKEAISTIATQRAQSQWRELRDWLGRQAEAQRRLHANRAPDFADPDAVIQGVDALAQQLLAVLADAESVHVVFEPSRQRSWVRVALVPRRQGPAQVFVEGLSQGNNEAVLRLPRGTQMALAWGSSAGGRTQTAHALAAGLRELFGERLSDQDGERLGLAFDALAQGRGDELAVGLVLSKGETNQSVQSAIVATASVRDAERFNEGAQLALAALEMAPFADPLEAFVGQPRVEITRAELQSVESKAWRARVRWRDQGRLVGSPTELWWVIHDQRWLAAAGPAAEAALIELTRAAENHVDSLAADRTLREALDRLTDKPAVTLFARPGLLGLGSGADAPLVLSVARTQGALTIQLDADHATLIAAVRGLLRAR